MYTNNFRRFRRRAFTLIEMLVSLALVLFIMAVLSEAFIAALQSYHTLKGIGDMDEKLRSTASKLRDDLRRVRFADAAGGDRKLSQVQVPPLEGYFRLWQGSPSFLTLEGTDPYGIPSSRATDHYLAFMIDAGADENARRDRKENWFTAAITPPPYAPGSSPLTDPNNNLKYGWYPAGFWDGQNFYSQQAEVSWCLRTLLTAGGLPRSANGMPLYSLYRRQLLAVPNNTGVNSGQVSRPTVYLNRQNQGAPFLDYDPQQQEGQTWSFYFGSPWQQPPAGRRYMMPNYVGVSCKADPRPNMGQYLYFNSPKDLTMPVRRFGMVPLLPGATSPPPPPPGQPPPPQPREMAGMLSNGLYPNSGYWANIPNHTAVYPTYAEDAPPSNGAMQGLAGEDLVLTNVISFDVKLAFDETAGNFVDLWGYTDAASKSWAGNPPQPPQQMFLYYSGPAIGPPTTAQAQNQNLAFGQGPNGGPRVFDTWSSYFDGTYNYTGWNAPQANYTSIPLSFNPKAIQIIIRIWDDKTESSRQITIVQDM
jgi:prepilin-type N-terminal cleavage/methylation domain-containing protein